MAKRAASPRMIVAALGEETTSGAELLSSPVASTSGLGAAVSFEKQSATGSRQSKVMQVLGVGGLPSQVHLESIK